MTGRGVVTGRDLLAELTDALGDAAEARWLLAGAWGVADGRLPLLLDDEVPEAATVSARRLARRRAAGEPLQYVLGSWAFRRLEVVVDPRVLVPRPETEQLVDLALAELHRVAGAEGGPAVPLAVDLGTGSGVVALSLAAEGPRRLEVWATDVSEDALAVARENLDLLGATDGPAAARVRLVRGSWFEALPARLAGTVHLAVSNPPYVSADELTALDPVVRDHEPRRALVAGPTGREVLEHLVADAPRWLAPGGALVVELAPHQAASLAETARGRGYAEVEIRRDLAGLERALVARLGP